LVGSQFAYPARQSCRASLDQTAEGTPRCATWRRARATSSMVVVGVAEVVDEHLLNGLVVGDRDVADGASADEVTNFFGEIFGMIPGPLERLGHEDDLEAGLAVRIFGILDVAQEDQVAQAIHLGVGAQDVDGLGDIAVGKCGAAIGQHLFEERRHLGEVAGVFGVDASADGLSTVGEAKQQVADAFEGDHDLHAGQKFAGFGGPDFGDGGGDSAVDLEVECVEFALALTEGVEQGTGAGGDAFRRGAGGFLGHVAGFHGAAHDVVMSRFRIEGFGRCAHKCVRRARTLATKRTLGVVGLLPPVGWDWQQLSIGLPLKLMVNKL